MKGLINTPVFISVEHMGKVALYISAATFVSSILTSLSNDKTIANFVTSHPTAVVLLMVVNMVLAGAKKYLDTKRVEVVAEPAAPVTNEGTPAATA